MAGPGIPNLPQPKKPDEPAEPESVEDEVELEFQRLLSWRFLMLLELEFTLDEANMLVENRNLDWHAAEYLLRHGFTREQAIPLLLLPDLDWETVKQLVEKHSPPDLIVDILT